MKITKILKKRHINTTTSTAQNKICKDEKSTARDDENLKESTSQLTEMHYEDFYSKQFVEFRRKYSKMKKDTSYFVNFNNFYDNVLDKRVSPKQDHSDPAAIYAYPLKYVIDHPMDIRYGRNAKFLRVIKVNHGGILHVQWLDMSDMNRMFKQANKLPGRVFEDLIPLLKKHYNMTHPQSLWFKVMQLSSEGIQKLVDHYSNRKTKNTTLDIRSFVLKPAQQTQMFRNLGFNAIEDRASNSKKAAVNAWEPEQIVILDRDAFEIVEVFELGKAIKSNDEFIVNTTDAYEDTFIRRIAAGIAKNMGDSLLSNNAARSNRGGYAVHYTKNGRRIRIGIENTQNIDNLKFGEKVHKLHKTTDLNVFKIEIISEKTLISYQSKPDERIDHIIGVVSTLWSTETGKNDNFVKISSEAEENEHLQNQQREELKKKQFLTFEKGRVDEDLYEKADSIFGTDLSKYDGLVRKAYADYASAAILAAKYAISENKFEEFISDPEYRVKITKIKRSSLPKFQSIEGFDVNIAASIGDKVIQFIINNPDKVKDKISEIRSNSYFPCSGLSSFFDEE